METSAFTPGGLREVAGKWAVEPEPGIVYVQSEKVNRFYLIAGNSSPLIEELSFVEGEARYSIGDASFAQTLPKDNYHVVRYVSNREHEVWREYELRLAFNPLMRMLVNRFGDRPPCADGTIVRTIIALGTKKAEYHDYEQWRGEPSLF
jgi:hypothetical protein